MAKRLKLKLSPAGILFMIAIAVLVIALIAVIAVLGSTCGAEKDARSGAATATPTATATPEPTEEVVATSTPEASPTPEATGIEGLEGITTPDPNATDAPSGVTIASPPVTTTGSPAATPKIYTSPTSAQKKAAKDGYVAKDKVKMRKGPATTYDVVKSDIPKNTTVTLYELQDGWWFLKCGSSYGYIRKDMIKEGSPEATAKATDDGTTYEGTIKTNSVAALRNGPSKSSKVIKEMSNGTKVTVYYKTKDSAGNTWYYVNDGKSKGYVHSSLISTSSKVPSK